jgi:hypothetical protein
MGDERPGQPIDAWIALEVTVSQLRQLSNIQVSSE